MCSELTAHIIISHYSSSEHWITSDSRNLQETTGKKKEIDWGQHEYVTKWNG